MSILDEYINSKERVYRGLDEFREHLKDIGWKIWPNGIPDRFNECDWLAARPTVLDAAECELNEGKRKQIEVMPSAFEINGHRRTSATMVLTGEANGLWFQIRAYGMTLDEFKERKDEAERGLVAAWNAIPRGEK